MEYCGERIVTREDERRCKQYRKEGIIGDYSSTVNDDVVIDTTFVGNNSRYITGSCSPNAGLDPVTLRDSSYNILWMYAVEDIQPGQQITLKYNYSLLLDEDLVRCNCGAPNCEGFL